MVTTMEMSDGEVKVGLGERFRAFIRSHTPSISREVDRYLSMNLPELIERHNLALRNELREVDEVIVDLEARVDDLEKWKENTGKRVLGVRHRIELLEKKYGVKG